MRSVREVLALSCAVFRRSHVSDRSNACFPRRIALMRLVTCVFMALTVSACDPVTERRYITEGAGADLYSPDAAKQAQLLNEYIQFICSQAGQNCGGDWRAFVQAGMNDIDQRCDGFLLWIDAKRRDREPVLAEISAINTAVHTVMTVTGSNPGALNIVTAAFGLASASYANWNSRLLVAVNQSTIQQVVYDSQGDYRKKIQGWTVPDQPTAIYLLRNYLRLCMPTTIEATINITTTLVHSDAPVAAKKGVVVGNMTAPSATVPKATRISSTFGPDNPTVILQKFLDPNGTGDRDPDRVNQLAPLLAQITDPATGQPLRTPRDLTRFLQSKELATQRQNVVGQLRAAGKL